MGIATTLLPSITKDHHHPIQFSEKPNSLNSMSSQDYQQGILSFSNGGLERSHQQQQQHHTGHQIRRDKLRVQGFEPPPSLVAMEGEDSCSLSAYETAGTLSEMFNFPSRTTAATELLENQIQASYRTTSRRPPTGVGSSQSYGVDRQGLVVVGGCSKDHNLVDVDGDSVTLTTHHQQQISRINGDSAAAMQLFLMNPQPKSPSPSYLTSISSTLHRLLPNPSSTSTLQGFHNRASPSGGHFGPSQFTWVPPDHSRHEEDLATAAQLNNHSEIRSIVEGQGLSLSLSSSLEHFESAAAKAEELRMGEGGIMFFNNQGEGPTASQYQSKNLLQGKEINNQNHLVHVGFGTSLSTVNVLRNSKYVKAGQELLEEFCSADRGQFKKSKLGRNNSSNPSSNPSGGGGGGCSSSSSKDLPPLSAADKLEHKRRKVKLLSMLDEVDRRYNHYCKQMQMVVNSFDLVMGLGAAVPYTALAQKAMSRHFKCIKDAVSIQLKHSCEFLGEKDGVSASRGVTKGETPRLRLLEQSLRQQKAFYQMGLMEQEAWRPQRGLPERSVNILRAWLLEHFLNPYPSDADKHLLARQTGLSRSQVSNWFINARVRLWKPMIEEMYEQESKEEETTDRGEERERNQNSDPTQTQAEAGNIENDHSNSALINTQQCLSENKAMRQTTNTIMAAPGLIPSATQSLPASNAFHHGSSDFGTTATATGNDEMGSSRFIQFGTINAEDVSLTLGLRHAGNRPDNSPFTVRDFDNC